jgi:hypothetical protein
MTRNSVLKKFDGEIENLWDAIYKVRDLLEGVEDLELSEMSAEFIEQISSSIHEGDISLEDIRDQIVG